MKQDKSSEQGRTKQSLGLVFILYVVVVLSFTMGVAALANYHVQKQNFQKQLHEHGDGLGKFIALTSSDAVISRDYLLLNQIAREVSQVQDVVYGVIVDPNNNNLTSYLNKKDPYIIRLPKRGVMNVVNEVNMNAEIIPMEFPIVAGDVIGYVKLGLSTKRVNLLTQKALMQQVVGIFIIIFSLSLLIYVLFRFKVLSPLNQLAENLKKVAIGDLDQRAEISSDNEIGELSRSFNKMSRSLQVTNYEKDAYAEKLIEINKDLESATRAKSAFLANMSHEIRTPLTAIIGFGQYLKEELPEEEKAKSINAIVQNGKHLHRIINDILDLSKIEAEKLEVEKIEVSLFEVISEVENMLELQAAEKGLSHFIDYQFPLPEMIQTDPMRFKQVLINLCNNAVKFTERGSVTLNIYYEKEKNQLIVDVKDTGIGLSEMQKEKIFGAFNQADETTTRKYGGTGLGLSLSRELAVMLGGELAVKSAVGIGSIFSLSIDPGDINSDDLISQKPESKQVDEAQQQQDEAPELNGNILLAEDVDINQELVKVYVAKTGAKLDIVSDGMQAFDAAMKNDYDLILMDMQMPIMDGLQATQRLREKHYTGPIVMLTANVMKEERDSCYRAGCDGFLAKPIEINKFYRLLKHYID